MLALVCCVDRWTAGRAALLVLAGGLVTLSNFYFGLFIALLTPVVLGTYRPEGAAPAKRARRATILTLLGGGLAGWLYLRWSAARWAS